MNDGELIGPWAELVIAGLVAGGVRRLVVCPGSRSTPFALTALRHSELTCWSVVDERSAGFFALGQAKATGAPTALLATSGTAAAHFFPAVIEARMAGCPLVLVSADRPHELVHCGAPQTIEQSRLFDGYVEHAVDLGNPDPREIALRGVFRQVMQAVIIARGPRPGPVHVNARATKPLEPARPSSPQGRALSDLARRVVAEARSGVGSPPRLVPPSEDLAEVGKRLGAAARGLIFCGALTPAQAPPPNLLHELARRTGFPLVCEATSQGRTAPRTADEILLCDRLEPLLLDARFRRSFAPEVILQIGAAPLGAAWESWLESPVERHVLSVHGWADPMHGAATVLAGDSTLAILGLLENLAPVTGALDGARRSYRLGLAKLGRVAAAAIDATLGASTAGLSEGQVVRTTVAALPPGATLVLGSSLPLRAVDLFTSAFPEPHPVIANRGTNGIDGLVSAAAGVASLSLPVTLLLGDVSFLHDVGGLWAARNARAPLVIVVLNDRGGRIFDELPVALAATPEELAYFTTPHALNLARAADLYGHGYFRTTSTDSLAEALTSANTTLGATVIDASLASGEPRRELAHLRAEVARRLALEPRA
ncbi:MAG: 2-succinyl-5-enolpyruvyl-6-hydroxy-3-cyclohexene-1-carboxylic-acid synthase [Polyangiaceae bacterium]|nr:2-succinyl-5-enolpyruvyl-6-hydroxy-3-cyclohexene-1-carboxylic-acid synthase [Polyangiaceae bacterium]